jgi:hypothetical protein
MLFGGGLTVAALKGCGLAVLAVVVLLCVVLWRCNRLVPDAELRTAFWAHRGELEQLRRMANEDHLTGRVHATYVDAKHLSEARVREYRRLMKECGVVRLWAHGEQLEMLVDATGMLDVGTYKGYEWEAAQKRPLARTLDEPCAGGKYCEAAIPLEGNWWIVRYEFR